jgi:hypothetical protein
LMSAEIHQKTFMREAVNWFASRLGLKDT